MCPLRCQVAGPGPAIGSPQGAANDRVGFWEVLRVFKLFTWEYSFMTDISALN